MNNFIKSNFRFLLLTGIVILVSIFRIIPHPMNFTPIQSMALFGGAFFMEKKYSFIVPIMAMVCSDIVLGILNNYSLYNYAIHSTMLYVYGSFLLTVGIGIYIRNKTNILSIGSAVLVSSVLFYVITNFGVWMSQTTMYEKSFAGLVECYIAAIPFFQNEILGNLFYTTLIFSAFMYAEKKSRVLQKV